MRCSRGRSARLTRNLGVGAMLACAMLAATASSALAWGDGDRDSYTVNITPASAPAGQSTTFDVALTNTSSPGSGLASAAITPPLGFKVTGASLPTGASGHVHVILNIVVLDHLNVPPGSTLDVSVTATAPSRCNWPYSRWFTVANEGGFFSEDLRLDSAGSSLTTPVTCATAAALKFSTQPNDTLVNQVITDTAYDTSGTPVKVELVDASGNLVSTSGTEVTIALNNPPGGNAKLSGTLTQSTVNGVATFNDLKVDNPNNGYTLVATSSGLTSSTSSAFDENDTATPCPAGAECTNTITSDSGSLQTDVGSSSTAATLTQSVDVGIPMDGPGSDPEADPGCASYTPPEASKDWYEFVVQPADAKTFDRTKTITWTVNNTTAYGFQVCFGAPYEFAAKDADDLPGAYESQATSDGQTTDSDLAPAGRLPDGTQGFVGLLKRCPRYTTDSPSPCVASLTTVGDPYNENTKVVAVVDIPEGLQGDPFVAR